MAKKDDETNGADEELDEDLDDEDLDDDDEDLDDLIFQEEAGYRDDYDWSQLDADERARHDELLEMGADELEDVKAKSLEPLHRWAYAQACARVGDREEFQETCRLLLRARKKHDGLMYEDIYLELLSDLAEQENFDEAFEWLDKFEKKFEDEKDIHQRVRGLLLIESGEIHKGKKLLDKLMSGASDRGEMHLEIGDDLLAMGHPEMAIRVLDRGKDFARRNRDTELMTAIDETRRLAQSSIAGE